MGSRHSGIRNQVSSSFVSYPTSDSIAVSSRRSNAAAENKTAIRTWTRIMIARTTPKLFWHNRTTPVNQKTATMM